MAVIFLYINLKILKIFQFLIRKKHRSIFQGIHVFQGLKIIFWRVSAGICYKHPPAFPNWFERPFERPQTHIFIYNTISYQPFLMHRKWGQQQDSRGIKQLILFVFSGHVEIKKSYFNKSCWTPSNPNSIESNFNFSRFFSVVMTPD